MRCPVCNAEIKTGSAFCLQCGLAIYKTNVTTKPVTRVVKK